MYEKEIPKSELLKNVSIEDRDSYSGLTNLNDNDKPIIVEEKSGEYYVVDGVDRLLNAHLNSSGDDMIKCIIKN